MHIPFWALPLLLACAVLCNSMGIVTAATGSHVADEGKAVSARIIGHRGMDATACQCENW